MVADRLDTAPVLEAWQGGTRLRRRIEEARKLIEPELARESTPSNGAAMYRALNRLHKHYPDLTEQEVEALVASVVRAISGR